MASQRLTAVVAAVCASLALAASHTIGYAQSGPAPMPLTVSAGIAEALRSHPIVCLGEGTHRGVQDLEIRLALLRDDAVRRLITDVVVEFGNARYQGVIDRFVQGAPVDYAELRRVWEDAVPADTVADSPVYEGLYRGIRDLNATLPPERRLRVWLGDPPIDWSIVHTAAELLEWEGQRDRHVAALIAREILARQRRALVFYGAWHCASRNEHTDFTTGDSLRALLEQAYPDAAFSVRVFGAEDADPRTLEPAIAGWTVPAFASVTGTSLGQVDMSAVNALDGRVVYRNGIRTPLSREQWTKRRLDEQFEAIVYLGPPSTLTTARLDLQHCKDAGYLEMRTSRMALSLGIMPGTAAGPDPIGQLRQYCANLVNRALVP